MARADTSFTAPSHGPVHETGEAYRIHTGGVDTIATITTEERRALLDLARSFDEVPATQPQGLHITLGDDGSRPGDDYNEAPDTDRITLELLARHGWEQVYESGGTHYLRRPGKTGRTWSATYGHHPHIFCPFTTSTRFESEKGYKPFVVYAVLEHGGDFSAAAKALREQGYGDPSTFDSSIVDGSRRPDDVWQARPELDHIRRAAHSRGRSADAVLVATLARIAADTPHTVRLPAIVGAPCGLTIIAAISGPPGSGKSTAANIATELIPAQVLKPECDGVPPGSGEGFIELLFDWVTEPDPDTGKKTRVHRQTRHNAYMYVDEGEVLTKLAGRQSGATLLPLLRSAFT
jgi:hypothetical protein